MLTSIQGQNTFKSSLGHGKNNLNFIRTVLVRFGYIVSETTLGRLNERKKFIISWKTRLLDKLTARYCEIY